MKALQKVRSPAEIDGGQLYEVDLNTIWYVFFRQWVLEKIYDRNTGFTENFNEISIVE